VERYALQHLVFTEADALSLSLAWEESPVRTGAGGLRNRAQGTATWLLGSATQLSKRAMLRFGIVPPPFRVGIDVTDRCNFRCPICSKWRCSPSTQELGIHEWRMAFDKLGTVPLLREVVISGGEPFMRPDILDILALGKRQGLRIVLLSNGWYVDLKILQQLEEVGIDRLMVSLNSLDETAHDESRGTEGSHSRIMRLIDAWCMRPRTLEICLITVVMEPNCHELVTLAEFSRERQLSGIAFQPLLPAEVHYSFGSEVRMPESSADWYKHDRRWVQSVGVVRQQTEKLLRMQKKGYPILNPPSLLRNLPTYFENPEAIRRVPCLGTLSRMHIDPLGNIRLCYGYPPVGNILVDNPVQVWRSESAQEVRKASGNCTRLCRVQNSNL
jgi:MoaA/NifB/PqqE/SkfB family radical SAM enzyme